MIVAPVYKDKTVGVFGLARTGLAAVDSLVASGATVCAWDDDDARVKAAGQHAVNLYEQSFEDLDALMLAPGVPLTHPEPHALVKKARAADVPLIGDFDVFEAARPCLPDHKCVAITGTNGKSTTTALVTHILVASGRPAVMAGNIGTGILSLDPLDAGGVYVFEASSYQIDLMRSFSADVAVLLNISPDHLDRHGDMEGYVRAKSRLFSLQRTMDGRAVVGVDDPYGQTVAETIAVPVIPVSVEQRLNRGVYVRAGGLVDAMDGTPVEVGTLDKAKTLLGSHNHQNIAAAYACCRLLGLAPEAILAGVNSFPGLAHRQELVTESGGVTIINDSKATNTDAAARALSTYRNIHWIAGGRAKEATISGLLPCTGNIKAAYLMGEAAPMFAADLEGYAEVHMSGTLEDALKAAWRAAVPGDCILLSPACAAFDQFADFEARGDAFKALVARHTEAQL